MGLILKKLDGRKGMLNGQAGNIGLGMNICKKETPTREASIE